MFYIDIRKDGEEEILFFVTIFLKKNNCQMISVYFGLMRWSTEL